MKRNAIIKMITLGLVSSTMISGAAIAGGFDRGGVNIDQLFDRDRFSFSSRITYVNPRREIKNVTRTGVPAPTSGVSLDVDSDYVVPRAGVKLNVGEGLDCLAGYSEPYGADAAYGLGNVYSLSTVEFSLDTQDYGLTCSYQFGAGDTEYGDAYARLIFGGSYMEVEGFLSRQSFLFGSGALGVAPGAELGVGTFSVSDEAYGWRAGVAYEIPEIALNATILYSSRYDLDLTGVQNNTGFTTLIPAQLAAIGGATLPIALSGGQIPQALEIKFQTGINETTLAFLNLKWQDWSQLQIIPVVNTATGTATGSTLDVSYQDGHLEEPLFFLLEDQRFSDVRGF